MTNCASSRNYEGNRVASTSVIGLTENLVLGLGAVGKTLGLELVLVFGDGSLVSRLDSLTGDFSITDSFLAWVGCCPKGGEVGVAFTGEAFMGEAFKGEGSFGEGFGDGIFGAIAGGDVLVGGTGARTGVAFLAGEGTTPKSLPGGGMTLLTLFGS